jgi:hypothetical protein
VTKAIGGILLALGLAALGALAWIAYRLAALGAAPDLVLFVIMAVLAAVGGSALAAGWRLLRGNPLTALGWRIHAGLFALLAAAILIFAALLPDLRSAEVLVTAAIGVLCFAGLAAWCFRSARRAGGSRWP